MRPGGVREDDHDILKIGVQSHNPEAYMDEDRANWVQYLHTIVVRSRYLGGYSLRVLRVCGAEYSLLL